MAPTREAPVDTLLGRAARLLNVIDELLEQHRRWIPVIFAPIFLLACWAISATKLLWFDELSTYYPARLANVGDLVRFFWEGLDVHTPTSSLLMRASLALFGDNHIGIRAPYVLGFLLMSICLFWFVAKRLPATYAAAAMVFPAITSVGYYSTEARPYAIIMGLAALALLAWRNAVEGRRKLGLVVLFLCLALAVSLHYYAVFLWIPFGLAELVRWKQRRAPDWVVWLVLILALFPLPLFFPAMQKARAAYMGGIWARPSLGAIENTYRSMLTLALAPMVVIPLLWAGLRRLVGASFPSGRPPVAAPLSERVLVGSLALLPVFVVPLSFLTGIYVDRYALSSIVGISIFLVSVAAVLSAGDRLFGLTMFGFVLFWFCYKAPSIASKQMAETSGYPFRTSAPFAARSWMPLIEQSALPLAVTPAVFFLQFQHYAPPAVQPRVYYLSSRRYAKQFDGIDTGDTNLTRFAQMLPLRVQDYDSFTAAHDRFLLIAETTNPTWLIEKLRASGAKIRLLSRQGTHFLFEVEL